MKLVIFMLLAVIGQTGAEIIAYLWKLWRYTSKKNFVLHMLLVVAIVFGGLAYFTADMRWFIRYLIGFGFGFLYEYANATGLDLFYFPNNKFLMFKNKYIIMTIMAMLWGLYPLIIPVVYRAVIVRYVH
ncbi:MAG: hypothetical protein M1381_05630 [Deltaproteobacteria bacterium]|nr:hypothetical protein [Deltaproteobacteria bacterium]MCL5791803.1 hypothetical protein [Deltaproteobacteria bacterium]